MSLILDALRKADAERERGAVPGLHAHPASVAEVEVPPTSRTPAWLWAALGLTLGLAIAVTLFVVGRSAPLPEPAAATAARSPAVPSDAAPLSAPAADTVATPKASTPTSQQMPPLIAEPAPWPQPDTRKGAARDTGAADAPEQAEAKVPSPAGAPGAEQVVVAPEQLPEHIRAQLPQLTFGGSIYSNNAASRSLIVNGRIHREADQVLPGLTLEQIKPKGAVFNFRGYRFEVLL